MAEAIRSAQRHVHVCSWHLEPDFDPGPREATPGARPAGRDRRARPGARARVGGRAGAGLPAPPRASSRPRATRSCSGTKIQCQLDAARPHDALPPREARDRRRRARVRRRHRPDRARRRPLRLQRAPAQGGRDRLARRVARCCAGRSSRDVAAHFALRWEATAGEALELPEDARARRRHRPSQFIRTVPEGAYDVLPRGEFSILESYVRALRSARTLIYLENQFLWSPEIVADPRGQAAQPAERRLPRRRPAPAQGQQRPGRHARDARPPRRRRRRPQATSSPRRSCRAPASAPARSTCTPRSASSTTPGWRSAPPTSTSTRSSTTPRSTSSPATRALARATRLRLWAEHLEAARGRRPGDGGRRAVAPDRERAARAPPRRRAADPPPGRAAGRQPPLAAAAGPARRAGRRRLAARHRLLGVDVAVAVDRRPAGADRGCAARRRSSGRSTVRAVKTIPAPTVAPDGNVHLLAELVGRVARQRHAVGGHRLVAVDPEREAPRARLDRDRQPLAAELDLPRSRRARRW